MAVMVKTFTVFFFFVVFVQANEEYRKFPKDFLLGAASAAYQIEGAWNVSDKAESIWDHFVHDPNASVDNKTTGDIASDSYHKYKEDVAIMKQIGLKSYRFSISWARILPNGFANIVSKDGVKYYKDLIDELLTNGIEPLVTIYHWDHPQTIEDAGGWLNSDMVDWFGDYARIVFREFGPKVKLFITINEPTTMCTYGYSQGLSAPGKQFPGIGEYLCIHNMIKGHARAYRIYEKEFKETQKGQVGYNIVMMAAYLKDKNDTSLHELFYQFNYGWTLNPIYSKKGDYPDIMKRIVAEKSREQGYASSRLPEFEPEWIEYIRGTSDFLAINHYSSLVIERGSMGAIPSQWDDQGIVISIDPSWKISSAGLMTVVPQGFGDILREIANRYGNPLMYVAENGFSDFGGTNDKDRIQYFHDYVEDMLVAIHRDGVNVKGYYIWSLLDNFEWNSGYSIRFGIVNVDFNTPERRRTLKRSAYWWQKVIRSGKLLDAESLI